MNKEIFIPAIGDKGELFPIEKMEAHKIAQLHLAVSIFVFDGQHLLMQRRACSKYHSAGQWANTCCTHPHWNEALENCASRRLREELGFEVELTRGGEIDYTADVGGGMHENERVTIFIGHASRHDLVVTPDPLEVDEFQWLKLDELVAEIHSNPDKFSPWLKIYVERFNGLQDINI